MTSIPYSAIIQLSNQPINNTYSTKSNETEIKSKSTQKGGLPYPQIHWTLYIILRNNYRRRNNHICGDKFYTKNKRIYCSNECRKIGVKYKNNNANKISQTELDLSKNDDSIRLIFNGKPINTWYIAGFTEKLKNKILERDGFKCYICGKETNLHVHHIIPREQGGPHIPENLVTLCGGCHRSVESGNVEKIIKKCIKALKNIS